MTDEKFFREPLLSCILYEVEVQSWLKIQCKNLVERKSSSLFMRMAGIGLLANHFLTTGTEQGMCLVRDRVATWLQLMPEHVLDEIELAAVTEAHRQTVLASKMDLSQDNPLELMVAAYSRELLEAVATLLYWRGRSAVIGNALDPLDQLMCERLELRHTGIGWRSDLLRSARKRGNRQEWWPKVAITD
ncbi:MAG: hypothetical protein WCK01_00280 [Candidatus Uhrbacteria bacterium]